MIKPMNGERYEREFEESYSKKLVEQFVDVKKIIIPFMAVYANTIKDVHKSIKIGAAIEACQILNKQLTEYFNKKRNYSVKELQEKNENFDDMISNLQKYYKDAVIELDNQSDKGLRR